MDIKKFLLEKGIIDEKGSILNDFSFREFIYGTFLFYLSFERYKSLFDEAIERQRNSIVKNQKPKPFALPAYPFRFVGVGNKTIFIGKMNRPMELFTDIIHKNLFWNYNYIDRVSPFFEEECITKETWKNHSCTKSYLGKYCEDCKQDFSNFAGNSFNLFSKSLGIHSYIIMNLPIEFFTEMISQGQESLIELEQEPFLCECGKHLEKGWICCPFCKKDIDSSIFSEEEEKSPLPENIFNEVLGLYLSLKKGYSFKSSYVLDKDFSNETDIFLQKEGNIYLIEFTTKFILDKAYVIIKAKNLNLIDGSLKAEAKRNGGQVPNCKLILIGINEPNNIKELEQIPLKILDDGRLKILKSGFKFNATGDICIVQDELTNLTKSFNDIVNKLLELI
jgi:hypothetical protein